MEGGSGEMGYEVIVEGAVEACMISRVLGCGSTSFNG